MCFLDKCYRNSEEGQVAVTLTSELRIFFIFYVDMGNQWLRFILQTSVYQNYVPGTGDSTKKATVFLLARNS